MPFLRSRQAAAAFDLWLRSPYRTDAVPRVLVDITEAIHQCRRCGAFWRKLTDGSWSLADAKQKPRRCCDNASDFLDQLVPRAKP